MSNDIALISETFGDIGGDLAEAMGFGSATQSQQDNMPVLSQLYKALKGEMEVRGKKMNVETIPGGAYSLKINDETTYYSETVTVRIFMQRFFYQRYEKFEVPVEEKDGRMFRTTMAKGLNVGDLKDNYGTFNCGRPGGFIKDYDTLSGALRDIVKNTKRVMAVFGLVKLNNPTDKDGNPIEVDEWSPFMYHVKNRDSYKAMENAAKTIIKRNRLPIQYEVMLASDSRPLPNGELNFFIKATPTNAVDMAPEDADLMRDFIAYIEEYNRMIATMWDKVHRNDIDDDTRDIVDQFVDISDAEGDDD